MNSAVSKPQLSREHDERIAAIREKAQRHIQYSARLFSPPPEEPDDNVLLPIPSLLAVACTAALANQAQAEPVSNEEELRNIFHYPLRGNPVQIENGSIELKADIILADHLKQIPTSVGGNKVSKAMNIDGENHTIDGNGHRIFDIGNHYTAWGNVKDITFKNGQNYVEPLRDPMWEGHGGAIYASNAGNISNSTFINNKVEGGIGGALAFHEYGYGVRNKKTDQGPEGIISGSTFKDNSAQSGGAIALFSPAQGVGGTSVSGIFAGTLIDSNFYDNKASNNGGALDIYDLRGKIEGSNFIGNKASDGRGGAIHLGSTIYRIFKEVDNKHGTISNSKFIGNQAGDSGGAIWSGGASGDTKIVSDPNSRWHLYTKDNIFLGNQSKKDGGAVTFGGNLHVSGNTLFYGNKSHIGYSSISTHNEAKHHYGRSKQNNLYIGTDNGVGNIFMFDPIHKGALSDAALHVTKYGNKSNFYLGGENVADYFDVREGTLTLTNVEYQRGSGYTPAIINTEYSISVKANATLAGSGSINSGVSISGTIAPSMWSNTGKRANEIDRTISDADIKAIGVRQDSIYGQLFFGGNVNQSNKAIYAIDIAWDSNGEVQNNDWLNINGSWNNKDSYESILRIDSLSLPAPPEFPSDTEVSIWLDPITVITTTDGINTNFYTEFDPSISMYQPG